MLASLEQQEWTLRNGVAYNDRIRGLLMSSPEFSETIPLRTDSAGVIRIGRTRVTLDTVVSAFCDGATAEEIVQQYPSLNLADVYHVIGYYLRRTAEVDAYLQARRASAEALRTQNEARFDPKGVRARLLARQSRTTP
jgi:uncharacterized protein (DUF433 family)